MTKEINNKTMLVVKIRHWDQIYVQIEDWLEKQNINVVALPIPPEYETVAVRFPSEGDLIAFKITWGARLRVQD